MAILVQQSEATAAYRRMYFHCVDATDGMAPETGEAGGQPQISLNGAGFGNTTNVLVAIGNGRYYVELVAATEVNSLGIIEGRYKSANTAESIGTTLQVIPFDPYDGVRAGLTSLPNANADAAGGLPISDAGGLDIDSKLANTNEVTAARMAVLTDWINDGRLDAILDTIATDAARLTAVRAAVLTDLINGGRLDVLIDAIKAKADNLPADPADDSDIDAQLATIAAYLDTEIAAIKAKTDNLPADPADDSDIDAQLATIAAYLDTEVAAILAAVDTEVAAIKAKTDNLPADPASETNVNANETKIDTVDTVVDAIKAKTDNLPADPASETNVDANETKIDTVDTVVDAIKAKTDNLPASPAAVGSEMNLADDAITSGKFDQSTAHPVTTAMQKAGSTIVTGTVSHDNTAATTTVFYSDDITEATADHFNGRIIIFTSGALLGQATDITDYALDTGEGKFTMTALTEAPADNDTFVIV